jgi:molybdopterin-guanine dinucleotide biosynthesis protein A
MRRHATAIVLAGGRSTRLGQDKAALEFGGRPLLAHVVKAVSSVCEGVIIAGGWRTQEHWPEISASWVPDVPGVAGPLAGLRAGIAAAAHPLCLAVACDMPFLSPPLLAHLLDSIGDSDTCVPVIHGSAQPLHAVYSNRSLPTIDSLIRLGRRSVQDLLGRLRVTYVGEQQCAEFDPPGLSTFNMNTPEDVRFALDEWARRSAGTAAA